MLTPMTNITPNTSESNLSGKSRGHRFLASSNRGFVTTLLKLNFKDRNKTLKYIKGAISRRKKRSFIKKLSQLLITQTY